MHARILCWLTGVLTLSVCLQVVEDITEFYKQTYANYKDTKQPALKETLRLIHFGVRTHTWTQFIQLVSLFWSRTHGSLRWLPNLCPSPFAARLLRSNRNSDRRCQRYLPQAGGAAGPRHQGKADCNKREMTSYGQVTSCKFLLKHFKNSILWKVTVTS